MPIREERKLCRRKKGSQSPDVPDPEGLCADNLTNVRSEGTCQAGLRLTKRTSSAATSGPASIATKKRMVDMVDSIRWPKVAVERLAHTPTNNGYSLASALQALL
jgi:hypothetical protein